MRDFNWSVNVLVKAYMDNTLRAQDCAACAVGNMIAAASDLKVTGRHGIWTTRENGLVETNWLSALRRVQRGSPVDRGHHTGYLELATTGYSEKELAQVEKIFECSTVIAAEKWQMDHGSNLAVPSIIQMNKMDYFKPLMAVVDYLAQLHGVDFTVTEEAKRKFIKA